MSLKVLPVVKAYPVIDPVSQTEAVCVAGISMDAPHHWIRLFPLDYRGLVYAQRFKKYEVIELDASKSRNEEGFAESQRALLNQASLFGDRAGDDTRAALEPLPVKAKFAYRCSDAACPSHNQSLIDWELGALHRSLAEKGDDEATIHAKIRQKFFEQYCSDRYDTRDLSRAACSGTRLPS